MKHDKIAQLRALLLTVERSTPQILEEDHGARFEFRTGAYEMRLAGISGTSTMSREAARDSWLRAVRRRIGRAEEDCPGHVASSTDVKRCQRCGIHIDELRPDAYPTVDVYSPWGSGPVPIERREG